MPRPYLLGHWQEHSHNAAVGTPNQEHIKIAIPAFALPNCYLSYLVHKGEMASGLSPAIAVVEEFKGSHGQSLNSWALGSGSPFHDWSTGSEMNPWITKPVSNML